MEAWIKVHHDLSDHPKVYALADELKVEQYAAVGLVVSLWIWAIIHAPDGDLERFPDAAIARACHWHKPAAGLVKALQDSGFLDGRRIHDWDEYAGALIEAARQSREKARKRMEAYRERKRSADASQDETCNADVTRNSTVTQRDGYAERDADVMPGYALRTRTRTRDIVTGGGSACARARESGVSDLQQYIGEPTSAQWEELRSFLDVLGENGDELLSWAVKEACDHGARNWAYVRKVLNNLAIRGIKTVEQAEANREQKKEDHAKPAQPRKVTAQQYTQRDYSGEPEVNDLVDWLNEEREKQEAET